MLSLKVCVGWVMLALLRTSTRLAFSLLPPPPASNDESLSWAVSFSRALEALPEWPLVLMSPESELNQAIH